jgi:hypothetical protein
MLGGSIFFIYSKSHCICEGLHYYQTYDWAFLMTVVCLGYFGWIATVLVFVIKHYSTIGEEWRKQNRQLNNNSVSPWKHAIGSCCIIIFLWSFLWIQSSPIGYYLYTLYPVLFWNNVVFKVLVVAITLVFIFIYNRKDRWWSM